MKINKVIISPPFGNYIKIKGTSRVIGSLTLHKRSGAIKQFIKTVRPYKGGFVNKIGLRNPGVASLQKKPFSYYNDKIVSLAVIEHNEWDGLANYIKKFMMQVFLL